MIQLAAVARGRSSMNCLPRRREAEPYLRDAARRFVVAIACLAVIALFPSPLRAEGPDEAKRHFTNGVHMFEDRNFAGALVEFEASYQKNPTAVALQNIAVCQKGLFRYGDAIATLERLLRDFGPQLSPDDKKAAEDAIRDMNALLGTIVVKVTPEDAKVSVNDQILSAEAKKNPIRLAAGEYRVIAEAPSHARQEKMVTVVSGQKDVAVVITLSPLAGMLVVRAHDSQAAIAIDGVHVGYEEWKGPVAAGRHEIYVYTQAQRHKSDVVAYAGQTTEFDAKLTAADAVPEGKTPEANGPPPYVPPSQRGLYGFLTFGADSMGNPAPRGLINDKARAAGGFVGLRLGYRISTNWAAELMSESAAHTASACAGSGNNCDGRTVKDYNFSSTRIGAALRLMSNGRKGRFFGNVGAGAAVHSIKYDKALESSSNPVRSDQTAPGTFFQLGGGYELNLGHFLAAAALQLTAEAIAEQQIGFKNAASAALELRVGYGQW
jgi:tetratricopeptide (TPR) repeat protein